MFHSSKSVPFCWNARTSSDIAANTKRRASTANQATLTAWATSAGSISLPSVLSITENIVCCICYLAGGRDIASDKRYKSHLQNNLNKEKMLLWNLVDWIDVTNICCSVLVKNSLFEANWNSEKWREAIRHISTHFPTLLMRIVFSYLSAFLGHYHCFLKHLIKDIVIPDSDCCSSFDENEQNF